MQPNLNHLVWAGKYLEQTYYVTREPREDPPGDKFLVFHKNESGYTYVGVYLFDSLPEFRGKLVCRCLLRPEGGAQYFRFGSMEESQNWILEQHGMWLKEQFEKAFS